jgi:nucleotide-binding universal stress UspA family protein
VDLLLILAMFKKILFPIDRSREAHNALRLVIQLVQQHQSEVTVLTVTDNTVVDAAVVGEAAPPGEDLGALLAEIQAALAEQGVLAEAKQCSGKPAFMICDVADEINADLIVMGSRGLDDEHSKESVINRVIGLSPCPILVVP